MSGRPDQPPTVNPPPQGGGKPPDVGQPPPAVQPPRKKKVKVRKPGKWVEVDVDAEIVKGRFRYVKFTDDDGLETYWLVPE